MHAVTEACDWKKKNSRLQYDPSPHKTIDRELKVQAYTAISGKVVGKNVHATIPKGNMGYDQYTVPDTVAVEPTFVAFLQHSQTYVHGLSCYSLKFLGRTVNSKPPIIPFGIVASTFSDDLFRNTVKPVLSGHRIKQTPSIKQTVAEVPKSISFYLL